MIRSGPKLSALALGGSVIAIVSAVLLATGSLRLGAVVLALSVSLILATLAVSERAATKRSLRSREIQQRDTRAVNGSVTAVRADIAQIRKLFDVLPSGPVAVESNYSDPSRDSYVGNTLGIAGKLYGVGTKYEYGERASKSPGHYETFALRTKSVSMRDVFARSASGLQFDYDDIMRIIRALRAGKLPGGTDVIKRWSEKGLLATARVVANQRLAERDVHDAVLLFRLVSDGYGMHKLGRTDAYLFAEALGDLQNYASAMRVLRETKIIRRDPIQGRLFQLNEIQSKGLVDTASRDAWVNALNGLYGEEGLCAVRFDHASVDAPIDSLASDIAPRTIDGPMVSVLVPTYNGSAFIRTTIRSLVTQTWKNLEIIVIDDGSDPEHRQVLEDIDAQYSEVLLVLQEENRGAYVARNRGLAEASGELVTVHDDDDWSHPQKLELQATHLLSDSNRVANMSRHARASDTLRLTRINNNPSFSQPNFSSLMVRTETVRALGGWDQVNRGADAEFRDRLVKATGKSVEIVGNVPHSFTRTHDSSLTAGEIGRGYIDPSRLFYQAAYLRSLERATESDGVFSVPSFPRPLNMKPGARGRHLGDFDIVFATDYRFPGGTTTLTTNEIEAAARKGYRIGMIQIDSPLNSTRDVIADRALDMAQLDGVEVLSLNDVANVSVMVVRHPTVIQFTEMLKSQLNVGRLIVIVNNPPVLSGGRGVVFELETVARNARALFGVAVEIVPESAVTRQMVRSVSDEGILASFNWPGFLNTADFSVQRTSSKGRNPVLGRHSRDASLKWPDRASTTLQVYSGGEKLDVRILGGISSQRESLQQQLMQRTEVLEFGAVPVPDFLASVDFWAYYHSDSLTESFGMATVEAMASGLVVFLPKYMEPNFGDGAVYCDPSEVRGLIEEYWKDPLRMRHQGERARRVVEERFSEDSFFSRLSGLIDEGHKTLSGYMNGRVEGDA